MRRKRRLKLDEVDKRIIERLKENAKTSFSDIARELNTTPVTVLNRVKKLTKHGIIKSFTVDIDWKKLGYELAVMIEIGVKGKGKESIESVKAVLERHPNIENVYDVTGGSDLIAIGRFRDHKELSSFVINELLTHENVKTTETRFIF